MSNPKAIEAARRGKREAIEKLYDRYPLNEPFETTDGELGTRFRISTDHVRNARADLMEIGAMKHERVPVGNRKGFTARWTLTTPGNVALARLDAKWRKDDEHTRELLQAKNPAKGNRKDAPAPAPAPTNGTNGHVTRMVEPDELVHIAGPDRPSPVRPILQSERKDEPRALIEAARQYARTQQELDNKIRELEQLGMVVDRGALAKAIKAPTDHQLVIVSKVLPYVEQLERANARHEETIVDLRARVADMPSLRDENRRLHEQNTRLVGEKTRLKDELDNRRPVPNAPAPTG